MALWRKFSARNAHAGLRDIIWNMYVETYRDIGLILPNPEALDEYDVWAVASDADDHQVAFVLYKSTPYGLKLGLAGTDRSEAGKRALIDYKATAFHEPGVYAEVSHKMEGLAKRFGAPVVCVIEAQGILGKPVKPESDGIHYTRSLVGVGPVTKVMVGRPNGAGLLTTFADPNCPSGLGAARRSRKRAEPALSNEAEIAMLWADMAGF
jgi:hypothetical protein